MNALVKNLLVTAVSLTGANTLFAQVTAFTYQGRLTQNGQPAEGIYDVRTTLFDSTNVPGAIVAGPVTNTATLITNGLFVITIDFGSNAFPGAARWLEIGVRTNGGGVFVPLAPRQPITAAPYAVTAGAANNLLGTLAAAQLSGPISDALLSTNIPRLNSNIVFSGAVQILNPASVINGTFAGDGSGLKNITNLPAPGWIWRQMPVPALMLSTFVEQLCNNSESLVITNILTAKTNGMWAAGWRTVLCEDGQYAPSLDAGGNLVADPVRFPNGFFFLANVAHTNGFKIAGYSSGNFIGCCSANNPGTPSALLAQHIRQHVEWGFDGMVIDACGVFGPAFSISRLIGIMRTFNAVAFDGGSTYLSPVTNRGMFLILNQNDGTGGFVPWESIYQVNCIGLNTRGLSPYDFSGALAAARECIANSYLIGPGHFLDPAGFYQDGVATNTLVQFLNVYYMTASPIQIGMNPSAAARLYLTNTEALAIQQDAAVIPCRVAYSNSLSEVWVRPLGGLNTGSNAVLVINGSSANQTITVTSAMLGQPDSTELTLRDPWRHSTISNFTGSFSYEVGPSNMVLLTTFNQFQTAGSKYTSALWMPTNSPPVDPNSIRAWFTVTNKNDGQIYKIPAYQ